MVYLTLFLKTLLLQGGYFIFFYLALYNYHSSFRYSLFLEGDLSCMGCLLFFTLSLAFCYYYYFCLFAIVCLFIHLISNCNLCHWSVINWANYANWLPQAGWEAVLSTNPLSWRESVRPFMPAFLNFSTAVNFIWKDIDKTNFHFYSPTNIMPHFPLKTLAVNKDSWQILSLKWLTYVSSRNSHETEKWLFIQCITFNGVMAQTLPLHLQYHTMYCAKCINFKRCSGNAW